MKTIHSVLFVAVSGLVAVPKVGFADVYVAAVPVAFRSYGAETVEISGRMSPFL